MVTVKYYGNLKRIIKKETETIQVNNMIELLKYYKKNTSKEIYLEVKRSYLVVNGQRISYSWLNKYPLKNNDKVEIYPVCGGG